MWQNKISCQTILFLFLVPIFVNSNNLRSQSPNTQLLNDSSSQIGIDIQEAFFALSPIVFVINFVVIWYNEKRAAINKRIISKVSRMLEQKETTQIKQINMVEKDDQKLVYISNKIEIVKPVIDTNFDIKFENKLKVYRNVEVSQQQNQQDNQKNNLQWSPYEGDNDKLKSLTFVNQCAKISGYRIGTNQIVSKFTLNRLIKPTEQIVNKIKGAAEFTKMGQMEIKDEYIYFTQNCENTNKLVKYRVRYQYWQPTIVSIIANLNQQNILEPFPIKQLTKLCCHGYQLCFLCNKIGQCCTGIDSIYQVQFGQKTKQEMIQNMGSRNWKITLFIRLFTYLTMTFAMYTFTLPIAETIKEHLPFLPPIENTSAAVFCAAAMMSVPIYLIFFSIVWLIYHPKTGLLCMLAALICIGIVVAVNLLIFNPI